MSELKLLSFLAAALVFVGAASAQEPVTIKAMKVAKGDASRVETRKTSTTEVTALDPAGKVLQTQKETAEATQVFTETILETDGMMSTRWKRDYQKAFKTVGGKTWQYPYAGKTVLFERKGETVTYCYEDGKAIEGEDAELLKDEFKLSTSDMRAMEKMMLPTGPLKEKEPWKIDVHAIVKHSGKAVGVDADPGKSAMTGTLLRVYKQGDVQRGELQYKAELALTSLPTQGGVLPLAYGSKMIVTSTHDLCLDGSNFLGGSKVQTSLTGEGEKTVGDGKKVKLKVEITATEEKKVEPAKK